MLAFPLKLLMVQCSVVCVFVFFKSWLFVFLLFSFFLEEFICKAKSVFFSPPPTPPPASLLPHFLLDLELSHVELTVRWARPAPTSAECLCFSLNGLSHLLQKMKTKCLRCQHCRRILGLWAQQQPAVICFRHASISVMIKRATLWQQHVSPIQVV